MKVLLEMFGLDTKGRKDVLREKLKVHLFGNVPETEGSERQSAGLDGAGTSASGLASTPLQRFPADGWKKLVDSDVGRSCKLKFNMCSTLTFFVARKEGDGLPADNFRSIFSNSFKLYSKANCRDGEVILSADRKQLFFRLFCKAEMKTAERYRIEMILTLADADDPVSFDTISYASCKCKAGLGPTATSKHVAAACYGLEEFSRRGIFIGITSCTSDLQKWNAPPAKRRVSEMDFAE